MNNLPQEPVILLSFLNTKLRDDYASLDELCGAYGVDRGPIEEKLAALGYAYNEEQNKFI